MLIRFPTKREFNSIAKAMIKEPYEVWTLTQSEDGDRWIVRAVGVRK